MDGVNKISENDPQNEEPQMQRKWAEDQLPHANEVYKSVFDNSPVAITVTDENESIIFWNDFTESLLGMTAEDLYMTPISTLYPVAEWEMIRALDIRQKGKHNLLETKVTHKNGQLIDVGLSVTVLKSTDGKVTGSIGILTDISERILIQEQLQLNEDKYRTIFENSAVAITITDEHENIIFWNNFTETLLSMDKNDLFMKPISALYPDEEWALIRSLDIRQKNMQHMLETRVIDKNGELIDIGLSVSILKLPNGKITGSIGMMSDRREIVESKMIQEDQLMLLAAYEEQSFAISEASIQDVSAREQAEDELQNIEDMYSTVFENSVVAITLTDENEKIIFWNRFTENLLGMSYDDLYMKPVSSLYPEEEWTMLRSQDIRQKGMQHNIETKMINSNQEQVDVSLSISVLKAPDGRITGSIGMISDISEQKKAQEQLHLAEQRYKTVFENSAVAITLTDENENIIFWNKYTESLLNMNHEDLYMKQVSALYPEDEWQMIRAQDIRRKGMQHNIETKIMNKNQDHIDVSLSVSVLKAPDGRVTGSIGMVSDITARKKAESELRESKLHLESILNTVQAGIIIVDAETFKVIEANPTAESMLSLPREEIIGQTCHKFICPAEEGSCPVLNLGKTVDNTERTLVSPSGEETPVIKTVATLTHNGRKYLVESFVDNTERKRAEDQLRMTEDKYRTIFENSSVAITLTDENENIIFWNKHAEKLLNMDHDDLYMKPISELYPKEEWQMIREQDIRQKGMTHHIETKMVNKDQEIIDVGLSVNVLKDHDGKITGSVGMITDLSEITKLRQMYTTDGTISSKLLN